MKTLQLHFLKKVALLNIISGDENGKLLLCSSEADD